MVYEANPLFSKYSPTASFGILSIDELHGLIAITQKRKIPLIFSSKSLFDIGLYCTNVKLGIQRVYCDIEFTFNCVSANFFFKRKIKKGVLCKSHRISATQIEWQQPGTFCVFRDMLEAMLNRELRKEHESFMHEKIEEEYRKEAKRLARENYEKEKKTIEWNEKKKAMTIFMLEDGFTQTELKRRYKMMMRVFHPDKSGLDDDVAQKINKAYEVLKDEKSDI